MERMLLTFALGVFLAVHAGRVDAQDPWHPLWTVDGEDPNLLLSYPLHVTPIGGGSIAIALETESMILVLDSAGRFVRRIGRRGDGPGEYRRIEAVGAYDGIIWVSDRQLRRVTTLAATGDVLGTRNMLSFVSGMESYLKPLAQLSDGSIVAIEVLPNHELASGAREKAPLIRLGETAVDTMASVSVANSLLVVTIPEPRRWTVSMYQPFSDADIVAVAPDGRCAAVVERRVNEQAVPTVSAKVVDYRGSVVFTSSLGYTPVALESDELDAWASAHLDARPPFVAPARLKLILLDNVYRPAWKPPVTTAVTTSECSVWVDRVGASPMKEWLLLAGTGAPADGIALPLGERIVAAEKNSIWTVSATENDVPILRRYVR
jgi:hypothetical protein